MEIEKVGCAIVRFKNGQVLGAQVLVPPVSLKDREQEREIRVVRIQKIQSAEIERVVSGYRGEVCVQLVVCFGNQAAVRIGEDARELTDQPLQLAAVAAVDDYGQGELAKRLAFAESSQTIAEILDIDLFRLVDQHISRVRFCLVIA